AYRLTRRKDEPRVDGMLVSAVLLGMMANSIFTESLGAPANAAFTWLYLLLAWVLQARAQAGRLDASAPLPPCGTGSLALTRNARRRSAKCPPRRAHRARR